MPAKPTLTSMQPRKDLGYGAVVIGRQQIARLRNGEQNKLLTIAAEHLQLACGCTIQDGAMISCKSRN